MGCDGGSIPKRSELVKQKKKPEQKDKDAELASKWKHCALSQERLRKPIVSCPLGRLYNKEAVIKFLLDKDEAGKQVAGHIRSLKDLVELKLSEKSDAASSSASSKSDQNGHVSDLSESSFICPVVGLEMNGKYRFVYYRPCGCVVSERAIKEVKSDCCHNCGQPITEDDITILNGNEQDIQMLTVRLEKQRAQSKKDKKGSKKRALESKDDESKVKPSSSKPTEEKLTKKIKSTSVLILPEKAKKDYSIAKDANASEAYKSLFTTHESAKNKTKNNWVTFNPLYN